jgi:hypothetical protein
MEIILGIIVIAVIAYVLTKKKDVAEANESAPAAPDLRDLPAGTEAAIVVGAGTETMVVIVPDAVAPAAVVEEAVAKALANTEAVVIAPEAVTEEVVAEEVAVEAPAKKKRTRKAKE